MFQVSKTRKAEEGVRKGTIYICVSPFSSLYDIDASHQSYSQFVYQIYEWVAMFEDHLPQDAY